MSDDTISRKATIDAMEGVDWYHINKDGQLVHGANSKEDEPLYKAKDVYAVLNTMPSAQPEPQKRGKGDVMVSDRELQVWQNGKALIIQSRYCDDPNFTLDQEKALHEIARSFLIVNRKRESDKRRKDRAKRKQEGE